jgi:hypothetical protein
MKAEHKAILAAAEKDGVSPMEKDAALIVHDMVNATRKQMARFEVGFNKMTEKQQDAVLGELADSYKETALIVARMIASAGTPSIGMTCKDLKISNGTLTGIVGSDEKYFNDLISKVQDKSEVLIVLYERDYAQGLDNIQADKDQPSLDLDGPANEKKPRTSKPKAEDKPIDLAPKMIEDAIVFVRNQQTAAFAAIQNHFKIGFGKAEALLKALEDLGEVQFVGDDKNGQYELVRRQPVVTTEQGEKVEIDPDSAEVFYATAVKAVMKAGSTADEVLRPIYGDDDNAIEVALMRMEEDGIVTPPSPEGLRDVLQLPA